MGADGVSFRWYPSSLSAGRELKGNFLQTVDTYPDMLRPQVAGRPGTSTNSTSPIF